MAHLTIFHSGVISGFAVRSRVTKVEKRKTMGRLFWVLLVFSLLTVEFVNSDDQEDEGDEARKYNASFTCVKITSRLLEDSAPAISAQH